MQPLPMKSDSTEISLESEETVSDDVIPDVEVTDDSKGMVILHFMECV